ncbi:glycosyltransferase [bacterium (Candidatus Blackallbacteria) CG17_big_fil_post_rev_8_21_14_2_50_48_46]|uniref:Glycosyltransferase n=1 Tax=bacterium (Candidatus Blackallbacteria) CG17_big_fil_post_rev_8_21_14_2_50_48_46 TaxID=2014261 RepID=A0A2M7GBG3_9BACT|nr:MAG: glycosyltransferase [bacterium (Candidatus Blackallbacteria) CG18_big_fil_WC_8_21_14_2_50_49_26]PIW19524.1 MAG: glycosyltransferase [bacterium (Candidatus Blackallbacteria) CG17_big_fil_post_rev_8_21_14_2_50_48_46]PIW48872.1 MAG: glycosyltransferase [bacterium (Candidatus Blackallbacteria) CG13_big_fil_rev_8_21_14_2_50_49_14]
MNNKKYRIAWIGKKSPFCGNVTYCRELVRGLSERGHEVLFVHFSEDPESEPDESPELKIPYLYKSQIYTIPSPTSAKILTQSLEEWQPDVVHASLPISAMDFNLPEICHKLGIPLVSTFHNAFDRRPSFFSGTSYLTYQLYAQNMAESDRVIIFSNLQKQLLMRVGVSEDRIAIVPNAIDAEKFSPGPSRFRERYPDRLIMTYMGRIAPEKGLDELLKVFQRLALPNTQLVMVGDGSQKQLLQSLYSEVPNLTWTGFLGEEERIDVLRGSDIFILPSQVEGLSIALLEAMACGLATVATDVGSDGEVLEGGAGIIINPGKVRSELSFTLQLLQQHPDFVRDLKLKARQRVLDRYRLETNIAAVEAVYHALLEQPRTATGSLLMAG